MFLRKVKYLASKPDSAKAHHHKQRRVGWQESSTQNNFRRIIAAAIPAGEFCNHKINYIPESDTQLPLDFVLALLNSRLADWFFRLGSSNAAVSHYQIYNLPAPTITDRSVPDSKRLLQHQRWTELARMLGATPTQAGELPRDALDCLVGMSQRIQEIESTRALSKRSERSGLAPESQVIQDAIDTVLCRCFGLTREEETYLAGRLQEML
jgi:hypothetical protein